MLWFRFINELFNSELCYQLPDLLIPISLSLVVIDAFHLCPLMGTYCSCLFRRMSWAFLLRLALSSSVVTGRVSVSFVYWLSLFMGFVSFLCSIQVLSYLNLACAGWVIITLYNIFVTILGCFHNVAFYDILVTVIRLFFLSSHSFGALWAGVCYLVRLFYVCLHYNAVGFSRCVFRIYIIV